MFCDAADFMAEGHYVVGRWEGGGTHTGPAFKDFLVGSLPAATDGVTALMQRGLLSARPR